LQVQVGGAQSARRSLPPPGRGPRSPRRHEVRDDVAKAQTGFLARSIQRRLSRVLNRHTKASAHGEQPGRKLDDQPPYVDVRARLHPEVDIRVRGEGGEAMLGQLRKSIVACLHFSLATNTSSAPPRDAFSLYSRPRDSTACGLGGGREEEPVAGCGCYSGDLSGGATLGGETGGRASGGATLGGETGGRASGGTTVGGGTGGRASGGATVGGGTE